MANVFADPLSQLCRRPSLTTAWTVVLKRTSSMGLLSSRLVIPLCTGDGLALGNVTLVDQCQSLPK